MPDRTGRYQIHIDKGWFLWCAIVLYGGSPEWNLSALPMRHGFTRAQALRRIHRLCDRNDRAPRKSFDFEIVTYGGEDGRG